MFRASHPRHLESFAGGNDLDMMRWAGTGVAISAHDIDAVAAADHHLDGPGSWHQLLDLLD